MPKIWVTISKLDVQVPNLFWNHRNYSENKVFDNILRFKMASQLDTFIKLSMKIKATDFLVRLFGILFAFGERNGKARG
ncbi:hypothetical protein GCM10022393_31840 [Aquimarina addita]|uniref:Uncharacterized protein n=1 Tax=Aquimarina addita TaxID=870485 RepID=A0ABP6UNU9_9FLAO